LITVPKSFKTDSQQSTLTVII